MILPGCGVKRDVGNLETRLKKKKEHIGDFHPDTNKIQHQSYLILLIIVIYCNLFILRFIFIPWVCKKRLIWAGWY